jgi:hypothetical protein
MKVMKRQTSDLRENNCQPRLVFPAKLSFLIERETKTFHREKLKEFMTTKQTLLKILKVLLHTEDETRLFMNMRERINTFDKGDQ